MLRAAVGPGFVHTVVAACVGWTLGPYLLGVAVVVAIAIGRRYDDTCYLGHVASWQHVGAAAQ
eukprot:14197803-Alexandrium_andersonii.AAC.1